MRVVLAACLLVPAALPATLRAGSLAWPLDQPAGERGLTSSFCEDRGSHLHGGVDLSTRGRVGVPVVAAADGAITRVKVRWRGLGRALYVSHAGGLTTVYGHLAGFSEPVRSWVEGQLARKGPYPGDLWPADPFPVRRGEVIAWSGKTGGGPPHLHFETRRAGGGRPVDPFAEGLPCTDRQSPRIRELRVRAIDGLHDATIPIEGGARPVPLPIAGRVRLSARVEDPMGVGTGGVRRLRATVGPLVLLDLDAAAFAYSKTALAPHVYDRELSRTSPTTAFWYWLHDLPGRAAPFLSGLPDLDAGALGAPGETAVLLIVAADGCGNESRARVPLVLAPVTSPSPASWRAGPETPHGAARDVGPAGGRLQAGAARLDVPAGALGETVRVALVTRDAADGPAADLPDGLRLLTPPVAAAPAWLPLRSKARVILTAAVSSLADGRAGVFRHDPHGRRWQFWGADVREAGGLGTTTDRLGTFALVADESPPRIVEVTRRRVSGLPWRDDADELVVRYVEVGQGVPWDGVRFVDEDGREHVADHDPDLAEGSVVVPPGRSAVAVAGEVVVTDRAGNVGRRTVSVSPAT